MEIQPGSIDYFALLELKDKLRTLHYNRLGLEHLDKLRFEVEARIESIHEEHKNKKSK